MNYFEVRSQWDVFVHDLYVHISILLCLYRLDLCWLVLKSRNRLIRNTCESGDGVHRAQGKRGRSVWNQCVLIDSTCRSPSIQGSFHFTEKMMVKLRKGPNGHSDFWERKRQHAGCLLIIASYSDPSECILMVSIMIKLACIEWLPLD